MPTARPIITSMFTTKKESSNAWPTSAVRPSATTIETTARTIGTSEATSAPKTTSRTISAIADAEDLAALEILLGRRLKSTSAVSGP